MTVPNPPYPGDPEPVEELMRLPKPVPELAQPEHEGEALGDFAETIVDTDGELDPDVLDEP